MFPILRLIFTTTFHGSHIFIAVLFGIVNKFFIIVVVRDNRLDFCRRWWDLLLTLEVVAEEPWVNL